MKTQLHKDVGYCEEELPKKPVGRLLAICLSNCWLSVSQQLTNIWSTGFFWELFYTYYYQDALSNDLVQSNLSIRVYLHGTTLSHATSLRQAYGIT